MISKNLDISIRFFFTYTAKIGLIKRLLKHFLIQ